MVTYRFVEADTPALRRLPFERMESEGIARAVIWNRVDPCLLDWLECVNPQYAFCWLAHDRNNALAGAVWLNPVMGLCGCVHFCIFKAARPRPRRPREPERCSGRRRKWMKSHCP